MYWRCTDVASAGVSVIIEGCFEGGFKGGGAVDTDECEEEGEGEGEGEGVGRGWQSPGGLRSGRVAAVGRHRDRRRCSIHDVNFARVCGCTLHDRVESNR